MKISIISNGDARSTTPDKEFVGTFKEFSSYFKNYRPNKKKHDGYFVRGWLDGNRNNANLKSASVLVLDGDKSKDDENSAPDPTILHEILKKRKINHFIYTTHSHNPPHKIKWRCVIECEMEDKEQLKPTLNFFFNSIQDYPLVNVSENSTWSQPWFLPNRRVDDGIFTYLSYTDGNSLIAEKSANREIIDNKNRDVGNHRDNLNAIRNGISYYKELQNILYGMARDGRAKDTIEADIEMIMLASSASNSDHPEHEKWQKRFDLIPKYVQQAIDCQKNINSINIDDINIERKEIKNNIKFPNGLMGILCENFLEMSPHPNEEIAIIGAFGLVAGICGRKFNVVGTGLNIYATLLADSGIGKSIIKDGINIALRGSGMLTAGSFAGSSRFTGPKSIYDMLSKGMSRVCVIEEAGLVNESRAGDSSGINRAMLDLYTSSGASQFAGGESYSDSKNDIPVLRAPALTVLNVSTPKSYLNAMKNKGAELSGEIARMWLTRSIREKTYINVNRRLEFSKDVRNRINELIEFCSEKQSPDKPDKVININIDNDFIAKESNRWVDIENECKLNGDSLKRTIASRAFMKTLKLAAIISVFNGYHEIVDESLEWAKNAVRIEMELIEQTFKYESSDDLHNVAISIFCPILIKSIKGEYKNSKHVPSKELQKMGMISRGVINRIMQNNKIIRDLDDDNTRNNPKTGVEKCLDYLVRNGYLYKISGDSLIKINTRAGQIYQITDDFKLAIED